MLFPESIESLVEKLMRLPTVGPKTAQRLAFHLLEVPREEAESLARSILEVKDKVRRCSICGNLTDQERCGICLDPRRENGQLCVVADTRDLAALERTRVFRGRYHVLGGLLSPMEGIGPEELRVGDLMERLRGGAFTEIILAMGSDVRGEATALYLSRVIGRLGLGVTRLASGLPMGADLEYADELTLARALEGRRPIQ